MKDKLRRKTVIIVFAAIVAVLQCVATFINFGAFPITLTLIPIIVAVLSGLRKKGLPPIQIE